MTDDPDFPESPIAPRMLERADELGLERADEYIVTCVVSHQEKDLEVHEYTFDAKDLDSFFMAYQHTAEVVVDVRPASD